MQLRPHLVGAEIDEGKLHRRPLFLGARAEKRTRIAGADRKRAAALERVSQSPGDHARETRHVVVERDRLGALPHRANVEVILQSLADAWSVEHDWDTVALQ